MRQTPDGIVIENVWVAAVVGTVVDPVNSENNVQGGIVGALGHAMNCEITFENGRAAQINYDSYQGMRMAQCPHIAVGALQNGDTIRGIGDPPVPPRATALASAIFALTGQRLRRMPFDKAVTFA